MIKKLDDIKKMINTGKKKKIAVAFGEDAHTLKAVELGIKEGLFSVTNFARKASVEQTAKKENIDISLMEIVNAESELEAIERSVKDVRENRANILMKGRCSSANYLRGILNKEWGLLPEGKLLSNAAIVEVPGYHKLLIMSDPGVIIKPTLNMKVQQIKYCVNIAHKLGITEPKVAILSAVETVNPKMESTIDGAIISGMNKRGQIKGCVIDGPLAMDLAISKEAADIKKIKSKVAGDTDILIFPNIETGNAVYKTMTKFAHAKTAGILLGTSAPCILPSRADSVETKFYSLLTAVAVAEE
ncbi:MAG: phosphate butyryltransferase [Nitrospiraceae bacterium]|nr:phosphate butyryltransferase [Nitrospiraceae bacterium]